MPDAYQILDEVARNGAFRDELRPEVFLGAPCISSRVLTPIGSAQLLNLPLRIGQNKSEVRLELAERNGYANVNRSRTSTPA
jgi:hypothetical protein